MKLKAPEVQILNKKNRKLTKKLQTPRVAILVYPEDLKLTAVFKQK